jgi:hypothetical protein
MSALDVLAALLRSALGETVWGAAPGHGSFLTFELGAPTPSSGGKAHGEWHLWVYCCAWELACEDAPPLGWDRSTREEVAAALARIDGQALTGVEVAPADGRTTFAFTRARLRVWPYEPERELWHLWLPDRRVLTVRGTGHYSVVRADTPEESVWQSLTTSET